MPTTATTDAGTKKDDNRGGGLFRRTFKYFCFFSGSNNRSEEATAMAWALPVGWPAWAVSLFGGLSLALVVLTLVRKHCEEPEKADEKKPDDAAVATKKVNGEKEKKSDSETSMSQRRAFHGLQRDYLVVYLIIMLADWLQGTNMYTLYSSYGQSVSWLFLTGFSSALFFGTFAGTLVDKYGRKNACVWFCVLEVIINLMEHVNDAYVLALGRVLGGISTSLLFTAFESWMVSEHRNRGFPEEWLASTFGLAAFGNGCVAVVAGVVAQISCDLFGDIGPFRLAIALTVVALVAILWRWPENKMQQQKGFPDDEKDRKSFTSEAWSLVRSDGDVARLCAVTSLYEGATYTFVFLWVPTLLTFDSSLPTGLVFACLMLCIAAGGEVFSVLVQVSSGKAPSLTAAALATACAAAIVASLACASSFAFTVAAFLTMETCVGCLQACASSLRALVVPDHLQSSVNNIGRAPLNLLVVIGTLIADKATAANQTHLAFIAVAAEFGIAAALQFSSPLLKKTKLTAKKKDA